VTHETHPCSVDGCPNLADDRVMLYDFEPIVGAIRSGSGSKTFGSSSQASAPPARP
jgi:hypothetical protein